MSQSVRLIYDGERMKTWHKIAIGVALIAIVGLLSLTVGVNTFFGTKPATAHTGK